MKYAIAFDLSTERLKESYHVESHGNAYGDIRKFLTDKGFTPQQGSLYFGDETVDAVKAVVVVQELAREYDWFFPSISDIRLLRIEDNNDLLPAIESVVKQ